MLVSSGAGAVQPPGAHLLSGFQGLCAGERGGGGDFSFNAAIS